MSDPDYLFDKGGPPDPDVQRLERLLGPWAHRGANALPAVPRQAARRRWPWFAGVFGVAAAAAALWLFLPAPASEREAVSPLRPPPTTPTLAVRGGASAVAEEAWVETGSEAKVLTLGSVGHLTRDPGSRHQVKRLAEEEARLFLERGRLTALVSADARPGFFQVDTPAARCVDLGCRYTLEVDGAGDAVVTVATGRVSFQNAGREVYVPAGATCRASRAAGAGLPCFEAAPEALRQAVRAFDAARESPAARRAAARAVLAATESEGDTLPAWHLLQEDDGEVAAQARARLAAVAGPLSDAPSLAPRPDAEERARWKERLEPAWR